MSLKPEYQQQKLDVRSFTERAFSVVASCGQQKRNALDLFQKAFCYHFSGLASPAFC